MTTAAADPDRTDLAEFLRTRSGSAFERLAGRYADMVYGTCLRLVRRSADAEDAAQAVFLTLAKKAGSVDPERLGGWLHRTAVRAALMANRAEAARFVREKEAAKMRQATLQPGEAVAAEWAAIRPHLDAEVERLPAKLRDAVIGHFFAGRSHAELAEELGIPRATAASRVQLGLERLRERLSERGVTLGCAALAPALLANAKLAAPASLLAILPHLATGTVAAGASAGAGNASFIAKGVLKMMFWAKIKLAAAVIAAVTVVGAGGGAVAVKLAAGEPAPVKEQPKVERKGALVGLPSAPGPHLEKIKALGDNQWLDLGSPAADPKWGKARGRSYSAKMPYAPDLQGAFLAGQGVHGFVKPDGRFMDEIFFYDLNAHRWICLYPGTDTKTFVEKVKSGELKQNDDGQLVDKDGQAVPLIAIAGHSYQWHTYDTDLRKYVLGPGQAGVYEDQYYGQASLVEGSKLLLQSRKGKADRVAGSPSFFNTLTGQFERYPIDHPHSGSFATTLCYLPTKKLLWQYDAGRNGAETLLYDCATHQGWSDAKAKGPTPQGYDFGACYDTKRDRICVNNFIYDVKTNSWSTMPMPNKESVPKTFTSTMACMHYDSANDRVIDLVYGNGSDPKVIKIGVFIYNPETATWEDPLPLPFQASGMAWNGFYSPEVNAHFFHVAGDSRDDISTMWVYRYKLAAK